MAENLFVVTVYWPEVNGLPQWGNAQAFQEKLSAFPMEWLRFNNSTWLIWSDKSSYDLQQYLTDLSIVKYVLILQADPTTRAGWAEQWVWKWIERPRI